MRKSKIITFVLSISIMMEFCSCGVDKEEQIDFLKDNLPSLESIRERIEVDYKYLLRDSLNGRYRIVFLDCKEGFDSSKDYICDDRFVLERMMELGLSEIRFEKKERPCRRSSVYNEVYFRVNNDTFGPIVYYLYEYCGAGPEFESNTIFYHPINSSWSVYIDSNFP